jgi:hypothetical protein
MDIFALATRKKYRFDSPKGQLSVEDLWDLPLEAPANRPDTPNLDSIAVALHKLIKEGEPASFVKKDKKRTSEFDLNQVKFTIVKFIIDVKIVEAEQAALARLTKEKNQRILEIIAKKDDESLISKSREELLAMLKDEESAE